MQILGIETTTGMCSAALASEGKLLVECNLQLGNTHSEQLMPTIDMLLGSAGLEPADVDAPRVNTTPNIKRKADSAGSAGSNSGQNVPKAVPVRRVGIFNRGGSQETQPSDSAPSGGGFFRKLFR